MTSLWRRFTEAAGNRRNGLSLTAEAVDTEDVSKSLLHSSIVFVTPNVLINLPN